MTEKTRTPLQAARGLRRAVGALSAFALAAMLLAPSAYGQGGLTAGSERQDISAGSGANRRDESGGLERYTATPPPASDPKADSQFRIVPKERMTVEEQTVYSPSRTIIYYQNKTIEADKMIVDLVTYEVEAEGNVVFRGENEEIRASAARYNFRKAEGVAWGVEGRIRTVYFKVLQDETLKGPAFRRISEAEALFRGSRFTGCNFPVPHYYATASEATVISPKRITLKNMTLYVRSVPVLWLPLFSRNFEGSPWSLLVGNNGDLGFFLRLGYFYQHRMRTPDWQNPSRYQTRSAGQAQFTADYFFKRGPGAGLDYRYMFDYGRHWGRFQIYGLRDGFRTDPGGNNSDSRDGTENRDADLGTRYIYRHRHNTMLGRFIMQWDADLASDPDLYSDVLDRFVDLESQKRGLLTEQRLRAAVTYLRQDWLARIWYDRKERIGLDRYTSWTEPGDNDGEFRLDPVGDESDRDRDERLLGLGRDRYGIVRNAFNGRIATGMVKVYNSPFYWRGEMNAFQTTDPGFNTANEDDDATVTGVDLYNSITTRFRLSDRVTWSHTMGVGVGLYQRDEGLVAQDRLLPNQPFTQVDGLRFRDRDTVFLGRGTETASIADLEPFALWADYQSRLNARFTDTLEGSLTYTFRRTRKGDNLGEFYERTGRVTAREDIYNFKTDYDWIEAFLNYFLLYPDLSLNAFAGQNLQSGGEIYANEQINYAGVGGRYQNEDRTFNLSSQVVYQTRQIRDRSDPFAFEQGSIGYNLLAEYVPRHGRWWTSMKISGDYKVDADPLEALFAEQNDTLPADRERLTVTGLFGGQVGPKHIAELTAMYDNDYDGLRSYGVRVKRDLHDAELMLYLGFKNQERSIGRRRDSEDSGGNDGLLANLEWQTSLRFKLPNQKTDIGASSIKTLRDVRREAEFVE